MNVEEKMIVLCVFYNWILSVVWLSSNFLMVLMSLNFLLDYDKSFFSIIIILNRYIDEE